MSDSIKELLDIKEARPKVVQCYYCKEWAHIKRNFPKEGKLVVPIAESHAVDLTIGL